MIDQVFTSAYVERDSVKKDSSGVPSCNHRNISAVKHIVMFGVREDLTTDELEEVKAGLLVLPLVIPEIVDYELGVDLVLLTGHARPAGKNRIISWTAAFASPADYQEYETHPAHIALINDVLKPATAPGTRTTIQYVVPNRSK